jgi:hypothetical protein
MELVVILVVAFVVIFVCAIGNRRSNSDAIAASYYTSQISNTLDDARQKMTNASDRYLRNVRDTTRR